jgi:hypothetical protein
MTTTLRVVARYTPTSPDHAEPPRMPDPNGADLPVQRRRIIGCAHKEVSPGTWGWVASGAVEEIAYHRDIRKAVIDGDLWAADEATAKACGVPWDPKCGGDTEAAAAIASSGKVPTALKDLGGTKKAGETGGEAGK